MPLVIAGTGHRPSKLSGYNPGNPVRSWLRDTARDLLTQPRVRESVVSGISGMALGWDQDLASLFVELHIPWIAAIPFEGQESVWPEKSKKEYRELLKLAKEVVVVSPGSYSTYKMQARNCWMVNHATHILAAFDGSFGGTANCLRYANTKGVPVIRLDPLTRLITGSF